MNPRPATENIGGRLLALAVVVLLVVLPCCLTGCEKRSPAPPEVLVRLKAHVEADGRRAPTPPHEDIFSMPGGIEPSGGSRTPAAPPADRVTVKGVKFSSSWSPLRHEVAGIPAGTVVHNYLVTGTRTKPDGTERYERQLFYVYVDRDGNWKFLGNALPGQN